MKIVIYDYETADERRSTPMDTVPEHNFLSAFIGG